MISSTTEKGALAATMQPDPKWALLCYDYQDYYDVPGTDDIINQLICIFCFIITFTLQLLAFPLLWSSIFIERC